MKSLLSFEKNTCTYGRSPEWGKKKTRGMTLSFVIWMNLYVITLCGKRNTAYPKCLDFKFALFFFNFTFYLKISFTPQNIKSV